MLNRFRMVGFAAVTALTTLHAVPALSGIQTWDFDNSDSFSSNNFGNSLSISEDGINLTVTGWSDPFSNTVEAGRLLWAQSSALGIQNRDETTNSPNHAVDSSSRRDGGSGYDMLLLDFDTTAVDLDAIDLTWTYDNGNNWADVSILAWDGSGSPGVAGSTWSNVLASNGGGYNSTDDDANVDTGVYYGVNGGNVSSSKWLIGVYNPQFGASGGGLGGGNDGFKLSAISTSTPNQTSEVPVPGTLALFMAGIIAMRTRKAVSLTC